MERVVALCGGCGEAIRDREAGSNSVVACPRCGTIVRPGASGSAPPRVKAAAPNVWIRSSSVFAGLLPTVAVLIAMALLTLGRWSHPSTSSREALETSSHQAAASPDISSPAATPVIRLEPPDPSSSPPLAFREACPGSDVARERPDLPPDSASVTTPGASEGPSRPSAPQVEPGNELAGATASTSRPIHKVSDRNDKTGDEDRSLPAAPQPPTPDQPAAPPAPATAPSGSVGASPRRFRVVDQDGGTMVARLHGEHGGKSLLLLPDGQLGVANFLVPTSEPFRPFTAEELLPRLRKELPTDFTVFRTAHYLIFYKSNHEFAESSGRLLEDLYQRLLTAFRKHDLPVHDTEFPLVAVIYPTEAEFRLNHPVDREIQAFYEVATNRIYYYEKSDRDQRAPEVAALRKPQTVAHEGTHQILQNIGVHPRMSQWPIWLIEGLAEYCATPVCVRKGAKPSWDGLGMINGLHMATIRELDDPLSMSVLQRGGEAKARVRQPGKPLVEVLIGRSRLTPTEYALAWAMTHYLAFKRQDDFVDYLRKLSKLPPMVPRSAGDHLADFREVFGADLVKLDRAIDAYLRKLARQKGYDPMPYYAVMFEQPLPAGLFRRAAMVSQSPQMIQQWVQDISNPEGAHPSWQALPHSTRARALLAIESWMRGM